LKDKIQKNDRSLMGNSAWNLLGAVLPLAAGIYAIPILIDRLGIERFGLLSLIWLLVGYFSVFDLGLSRALTKILAEYSGNSRDAEMPVVFRTAIGMMLGLGLIASVSLWSVAPFLVASLNVSTRYFEETILAFKYAALGLPFILMMAGLRGALEAFHEFKALNLIRIPIGVINFLLPLPILIIDDSLGAVVLGTIATRCACIGLYYISLKRRHKNLLAHSSLRKSVAKKLVGFGGWMTVSNIVGPLMTYIDGFVISAMISASAVAIYTVPYELATKVSIIPLALIAALFPLLAQKILVDSKLARSTYFNAAYGLLFALFPVVILGIGVSEIGLKAWLGEEISVQSAPILKILLLGVFVNSFALLPFTLLQSAGYPKVTAIVHVAEFPLYFVGLVYLLSEFGILGGAFAWFGRILLDFIVLLALNLRYFPSFVGHWIMVGRWLLLAFLLCLVVALLEDSQLKTAMLFVIAVGYSWLTLLGLRKIAGSSGGLFLRKLK
jgi:O-antigen/teichoic acid export membrane protein